MGPALHEGYKDVLQPTAREVGANLLTVAKLVTAAFMPLRGAIWGFEKIEEWLSVTVTKKLAHVRPENIRNPPLDIAGPVLMQMSFVEDQEELKEMFANLLASSMNTETANNVHRSFVRLIEQMSGDEARILKHISSQEMIHSIIGERDDDPAWHLENQFKEICQEAQVALIDNSSFYLVNLIRLGIFEIEKWESPELHTPSRYVEDDYSIVHKYSKDLNLTPLGERFLSICVRG